jgi:hypothetical protein
MASAKSSPAAALWCEPKCCKTYKWPSYKVSRHWLKFLYKYGNTQIHVLPLMAKEVAVLSSTEAFPMAGLALQVEVPTTSVTANISSPTVWEECWNFGLEVVGTRNPHLAATAASIQLEVVGGTSKAARLWQILPMVSWVLDPFENPVTWKIDSWLRIWILNWIENTCLPVMRRGVGSRDHPERWDAKSVMVDRMGRSLWTAQITLIISYRSKQCWNWTNCVCWNSYLQHRPHVRLPLHQDLYQILIMFESVLRYRVSTMARRPSGWGSGGSMPSGIIPTVHPIV